MKTLSYIWNVLIMAVLFMHFLLFKNGCLPLIKKIYGKESDSVNPARVNYPRTLPAFYYSCQKKEKNPTILLFWLLRSSHRSTEQLKSLNNVLWIVKQRIRSQWKGLFWKKIVFTVMSVPVNGRTNWNIQKYFTSLTMHDILIRLWWQAFLFMKGDVTACF